MPVKVHAVEDSFESVGRHIREIIDQLQQRSYYRFSKSPAWEPTVNILEDDTGYHICAELAGLRQEQIQVEVVEQRLRIHGERAMPKPAGEDRELGILHMEINSGRFDRLIDLPTRADAERIEARLSDGLLWIVVPKLPE